MVWGNFEADRNKAQGETLLKVQKRFMGIIAGKGGRYHADPLFAKYGISSRGYMPGSSTAAGFLIVRRPCCQRWRNPTAMGHGWRAAGWWLARTASWCFTRFRRSKGTLTEEQRAVSSISGFKRSSKGDFLVQYGAFLCGVVGCWAMHDDEPIQMEAGRIGSNCFTFVVGQIEFPHGIFHDQGDNVKKEYY
jgi:hypothetical protein